MLPELTERKPAMSDYSDRKLLKRLHALSSIEVKDSAGEQAMDRTRRTIAGLKDSSQPGGPKAFAKVLGNPVVWYAAAAILLIGIVIGGSLIWNIKEGGEDTTVVKKEDFPKEKPVIVKEVEVKESPVVEEVPEEQEPEEPARPDIESELKRIYAMAKAEDVEGLIGVLEEGEFAGKLVAASYLMKIGDESAIEPLEKLSAEWYGDKDVNPFSAVIAAIRKRVAGDLEEVVPEVTDKPAITKESFKPRGVLSGLITDKSTGLPIKGVRLEISNRRYHRAETDPNGFYYLDEIHEDGNHRIKVESREYMGIVDWRQIPQVALRNDAQVVRHFDLERGCQVEAYVVNDANEHLEDVQLNMTWLGGNATDACEDTKTDAKGYGRLGAVKPSDAEYLIIARRGDYAMTKYVAKLNDASKPLKARIVMHEGVDVKGYAEYQDGVPAEGLKISAHPQWWHSNYLPPSELIDSEGNFALGHITPGVYRLQVHIPHGQGSLGVGLGQFDLPLAEGVLRVVVPRKSPGSLVSIRGKAVFVGGRPSYVTVETYSESGPHEAVVRGDGAFELDGLEPGIYSLRFGGIDVEETDVPNVRAPSDDLEVELQFSKKPRLRGFVVGGSDNKPVMKFRTRAMKVKTLRGMPYVQSDRWFEFDDSRGEFNIDTVGPGIYQVQVAADGFAWTWSDGVNTDDNAPVTVKLTPGGTIKGIVLNQEGKEIDGAKVSALSRASGTETDARQRFVSDVSAVVTKDGAFVLEHLAAGIETIKVSHDDYGYSIVEGIEVREGGIKDDVVVVLARGGAVQGNVYDAAGIPQANVIIHFQDATGYMGRDEVGRIASVVTDEKGYYSVTGLPEQMCYMKRSDDYQALGVVRRAVLPSNGKQVRVDFGGYTVISGEIVIDGEAFIDGRIALTGSGSGNGMIFGYFGKTDSQGGFALQGIPVGTYDLYYEPVERQRQWTPIATVESTGESLDMGVLQQPAGRLIVRIEGEDPNKVPQDSRVYLQAGYGLSGSRAGKVNKPVVSGDPFIISEVPEGKYTVVVNSGGWTNQRRRIEFDPRTEKEMVLWMKIRGGTGGVSGQLISDSRQSLILVNSQGTFSRHLSDGDSQTYEATGLPEDSYMICNYTTGDIAPLVEFDLIQGQRANIDIDTASWSQLGKSALYVQVVTADGVPIVGAEVWLADRDGEITPLRQTSGAAFFVVDAGEYAIHATYPGFEEVMTAVLLKANDISAGINDDMTVIMRLAKP